MDGLGDLFLDTDYIESKFVFGEPENQVQQTVLCLQTASTDYDLTGQILWPACSALCHHLVHSRGAEIKGKKVLELGSGVGLLSLIACHFHPSKIVCTDGNETVLSILTRNMKEHRQNTIPHEEYLLEWGQSDAESFLKNDCKSENFEVVLVADCTYSADATKLLLQSIQVLMKEDGVCLLAHKSRWGIVDEALVQSITDCGFSSQEISIPQVAKLTNPPEEGVSVLDNSVSTMHLFRLTKFKGC